jgi:hypothetical protein
VDSVGNQTPGAAVGVAGLIATGNPAGLIVSSGMKLYGERSGSSTLEGRAAGPETRSTGTINKITLEVKQVT